MYPICSGGGLMAAAIALEITVAWRRYSFSLAFCSSSAARALSFFFHAKVIYFTSVMSFVQWPIRLMLIYPQGIADLHQLQEQVAVLQGRPDVIEPFPVFGLKLQSFAAWMLLTMETAVSRTVLT